MASSFELQDVGLLANSGERTFGLQTIADKFLWVCLKVKKNFSLVEARYRRMCRRRCFGARHQV
jgi:hypothetical protein